MIRKASVEGGKIAGIPAADPRITAFKGIPFAAPPVGELRWRAPQPVIPWAGERECFTFAPISVQHIPGLDKDNIYSREWNVDPDIVMDEDCLYLNVWTPAKSPDEKLPVFVWYFGGGLHEGNPAEMEFDGERIARRGIVVVTVNYRLNVFGFLTHPELTKAQPGDPANFGHLDQRAGIIWVKRNIAAFGGDPNNITIGGQSAGGGSVCAQLTSPMNEGLFQKAVIMSGIVGSVFPHPIGRLTAQGDDEQKGVRFFDYLGVKTLAEARALDQFYIRDKYEAWAAGWGNRFSTSVDGVFQTANHFQNLLTGKFWHMPLMVTRTSTEFFDGFQAETMTDFRAGVKQYFGDRATEFLALCDSKDPVQASKDSAVSTMEIGPRAFLAQAEALDFPNPIFYNVFDPSVPGWDNPGTFHSCDLWFWFETLAKCWRPFKGFHMDLARQMCNYLCNFIRSGDPNGSDHDGVNLPDWAPAKGKDPKAMWFQDTGCVCRADEADPVTALTVETFLEKRLK